MPEVVVSGISSRFRGLSPSEGQIAHVLLTRSPLVYSRRSLTARLACVKHAASVRPEPGSNSPLKSSDAALESTAPILEMSRQETITDYCQNYRSYQRDRRPRRPADRAFEVRRGYQTNSSTFDTLLSSQGSSAHRSPASRLTAGQPAKTYRANQAPSNRFLGLRAPHRAPVPNRSDGVETRPRTT